MKTINDINQELNDLLRSIKKDTDDKEIKSVKIRASFLRMCLRYLETSPRESFIKSQLDEVNKRIELIPTHFASWQTGRVLTKYKDPYSAYCTEMGLPDLKAQVKTLEYLLS